MSTHRDLTVATQDLVESVAALIGLSPVACGRPEFSDAWQGLDQSYQDYLAAAAAHLDSAGAASGRDTSIAAAKQYPLPRGLRRRILDCFVARWEISRHTDGLLTEEVEKQLRKKHTSVSSAVNRLEKVGLIRDSGRRRLTEAGYRAIIYIPTDRALELIAAERDAA